MGDVIDRRDEFRRRTKLNAIRRLVEQPILVREDLVSRLFAWDIDDNAPESSLDVVEAAMSIFTKRWPAGDEDHRLDNLSE
jgi:hypothetical protein